MSAATSGTALPACRFAHEGFSAPRHRHCEEPLRRSNPDCLRGGILDCFAALAMTDCERRRRSSTCISRAPAS
ncbi:hypothetical protein GPL20_16675 [Bradyrhizobium cajani]|uniref:Uncharacterized protein n=1 Tax=Bradyrhizobium cajani TaxID=1928661 RepID=A0A844TDL2_9BRAD|nr:hypothetical protein [Bradyrhizobium cajani]